jgi:AcrR family transcriptional regulator
MSRDASRPRPADDGEPAAPARRGRPPVDLNRVVAEALDLVDEVGVPAFAMRLLADRLNSGTATLYRHFANKDEILVHVLDLVLGQVEVVEAAPERSWQEAITLASAEFYLTLRRHPNVLPLLVSHIPVGPNGLANRERVLALLLAHGFTPDLAARAFLAIGHYVVGFAIQQHSPGATDRDAKDLPGRYDSLDASTFAAITTTAPFLRGRSVDEEFHFGLELLLIGLDHLQSRSND